MGSFWRTEGPNVATLRALAIQMRALAKEVPVAVNELRHQTASAALDSLIDNSPADTSTLISNWRVTDGAPEPPISAYSLGRLGSTREASAASARAAGQAAIAAILPGKPIVIYNSVPYARYVNDGSSDRAPHLFVEKALIVGNNIAKSIGLKLGVRR
jgi:hypothetical protein